MIDCIPFLSWLSVSFNGASENNYTFVSSLFTTELIVETHLPHCDRFLKASQLSINDLWSGSQELVFLLTAFD